MLPGSFRRFFFAATVLTVMLSSLCPSYSRAGDTDSLNVLLESFSQSYSLDKANGILSALARITGSDEIETFSRDADESLVQTNVWYYAADYMYGAQQYGKSVEYAEKALDASRRISDKDFEADVLSLLAIGNMRMGNYERAAYYAEQCYALDRKSKDPDRISSSLNTLAGIYLTSKRYPEAEKYVLKGIEECSKTTNKPRMAILLGMASEVYQSIGKSDIALDYAQKAYDMEKELGREPQAMVRLSQRAAALLGLGRMEEAEADLKEAIPYFRKIGNLQSLGISCNKMGRALLFLDRKPEALDYFREAADIFMKLGDPFNELHSRKGLYECLLETDSKEASRQHDRYDALKDSIYNLSMAESLSRYEASMGNDALRAENAKALRAKYSMLMWGVLAAIVVALAVWLVMHRRSRRQKAVLESTIRSLRSQYNSLRSDYAEMARSKTEPEAPSKDIVSSSDRSFLEKLVSYVLSNLTTGRLGVEDLASHMCLSSGQLNRKVKSITGITTQNYMLRLRLEQARLMLQDEPDSPVADVAYRCGFEDAASFSRAFKRTFDSTPSQIRGK